MPGLFHVKSRVHERGVHPVEIQCYGRSDEETLFMDPGYGEDHTVFPDCSLIVFRELLNNSVELEPGVFLVTFVSSCRLYRSKQQEMKNTECS
jgi:hypothetical protein